LTAKKPRKYGNFRSRTPYPRLSGKALQGDLKGLWRYRVGNYRLIAQIKDNELIIYFGY
jgi:mRNA-degrading endonuclease RelE of RelBE toxin-antitoxin system